MSTEQLQHRPLPPPIEAGSLVPGQEESIALSRRVHSPTLSERWAGRGQRSGDPYEVLLATHPRDLGPLLAEDAGSWGASRVTHEGRAALIFPTARLTPLSALIQPPDLDDPDRHRRAVALLLSLAELFEVIHELCDALIAHADLDMFAIRTGSDPPEAILLRPELTHPQSDPPRSGSYQGSGLDAPELSGWITRPVSLAADVHILGMLAYALLTGVTPSPGAERFAEGLPPLRAFDPDTPLGLDACVRRAITRTPERRYATVARFAQALREVIDHRAPQRQTTGDDGRITVAWGVHSEIGRGKLERHPINQDSHLESFDPDTGWGLFAVMDGVSRSDVGSGELASWLARSSLEREWNLKRPTPIYGRRFSGATPFPTNLMEKLSLSAHAAILDQIDTLRLTTEPHPGERLLSTTLAAAGLFGDRCALCNVGDSPIFLIRLDDRTVEHLSIEHNQLLTRLRAGWSIPDAFEAPGHRQLTSVLGLARCGEDGVEPMAPEVTTWSLRLRPGDLLAICSDGVTDAFGKETSAVLLDLLTEHLEPHMPAPDHGHLTRAARALVQLADARGGRDNITALLVAAGPWPDEA
ncbi:MAG: hypothetical protein CMH57_02125 [Myxococcales bacterium]|nr:hypothetical protein [Myxococcales bacterium]